MNGTNTVDQMENSTQETPSRSVIAFDRDYTVAVGELSAGTDRELVPLEWVRHLAHETPHIVYATGNQMLTDEADIPGIETIVQEHPRGTEIATEESPDLSARSPSRETRVDMLADIYPDAAEHIVVDDVDLSDLDRFTHYTAWDFVERVRDGDLFSGIVFPEGGFSVDAE